MELQSKCVNNNCPYYEVRIIFLAYFILSSINSRVITNPGTYRLAGTHARREVWLMIMK
jgi:hypothetical protein